MNELIVSFISFFATYGLGMTIAALCCSVILGLLKYSEVFSKFQESTRHYIYLVICIVLSFASSSIYLAIESSFTVSNLFIMSSAIFTINQTCYNIFKVTPVNELLTKFLDLIVDLLTVKKK